MSAEPLAWPPPATVTLDDLATLAATDEFHRYELTIEGVVHVMPPADVEHQQIASRLMFWFFQHGYTADNVLAEVGIQTGDRRRVGGRQPDLSVWDGGEKIRGVSASYLLPAGALLFIEIVSPSSRRIDRSEKSDEYAQAAVPRYWRVERDGSAPMVHRFTLDGDGYAADGDPVPLAWLLSTTPELG